MTICRYIMTQLQGFNMLHFICGIHSAVEFIQNTRYPKTSRVHSEHLHQKSLDARTYTALLGNAGKTITLIVAKEAGTLHSNSHVENPS